MSRIGEAVEVGVEIGRRAEEITGTPTLFGIAETGPFIGVEWLYPYADAAEAESANVQMGTDERMRDLIRKTKDLFIAGATTRTLYRKLN